MKLGTIVQFLNQELKVKSIRDDSKNGLQFKARTDANKIGFAVDACLESFQRAKELNCDLIIVHHGLLWKQQKFKDITSRRISFLKKNRISLYGVHLPLDGHPVYGNNAQLCSLLGISKQKPFGKYHGKAIGFRGTISKQSLSEFVKSVEKKLLTSCRALAFGSKMIGNVGIVSGGGRAALEEAIKLKLDCFLTGEVSHSDYHRAKESRINVIIAGHYATETLGVKAIQKLLKHKFNIETVFIDVPTGM